MAETVQDNLSVTESTGSSSVNLSVTEAASVVQLESSGNSLRLAVDTPPSGASIGTVNAFPFTIRTGGEPRLLVEGSGNVGIGTTAPLTAKLEVAGAVKIQNNLTVQGDLELGNDDTDQVKIHGIVRSTHSSGELQIGSNLAVNADIKGNTLRGTNLSISQRGGQFSNMASFESQNPEPPYVNWLHHKSGGTSVRYGYIQAGDFGDQKELRFATENGASFTFINGNVGIGTTAPNQKLDVAGNIKISGARTYLQGVDGASFHWIMLGGDQEGVHNRIGLNINGNTTLTPFAGNVGIGTNDPRQKLHVVGGHVQIGENRSFGLNIDDKFVYDSKDIGHYSLGWFLDSWLPGGATAWLSGYGGIKLFTNASSRLWIDIGGNIRYAVSLDRSSSRKLKENVADLPVKEAINTLEGLNPVTYHLKADEEKNLQIGFIAEDVPDLVASRDRKAVSTDHIVAILTKVVKEQQAAIAQLTKKINMLEANEHD